MYTLYTILPNLIFYDFPELFVFVLGAFWTQRQGTAYVCLRVVGAVRTLLTMAQSTTAEHHAQVDAADRRLGTDADHLGMDLDFCARCLLLCICIRKGTRL